MTETNQHQIQKQTDKFIIWSIVRNMATYPLFWKQKPTSHHLVKLNFSSTIMFSSSRERTSFASIFLQSSQNSLTECFFITKIICYIGTCYLAPSPLPLFWTHTDLQQWWAEQRIQMGGGEKGGNGAGTIKNSKEPKSHIKLRLPPTLPPTLHTNTRSSVRNYCYLFYTEWVWKLQRWAAA